MTIAVFGLVLAAAPPAHAQDPPTVQELQRIVSEQKKHIEAQQAQLDKQGQAIHQLQQEVRSLSAEGVSPELKQAFEEQLRLLTDRMGRTELTIAEEKARRLRNREFVLGLIARFGGSSTSPMGARERAS